MAEYIEREALYEKAYWHGEHPDVSNPFPDGVDAIDIEDVDAIPAADVAPVIRATWVLTTDVGPSELYHCSRCGREEVRFGKSSIDQQYPYCHCGAKMDKGAE